ncbi:Transmembrane protease serine 9 [Chamberlinius hualienensis]
MVLLHTVIFFLLQTTNFAEELHNEQIAHQLSRLFEDRNDSFTIQIKTSAIQDQEREFRLDSVTKKVETRAVCDCGTQQFFPQRIFGGTDAFPNEYPWMVAIVFPPGQVTCGAALISHRFALSAAHCFLYPASAIFAILGAYDLRLIGPQTPTVPVRQVVINPKFNRSTGDNDLALVEFAYPIQYNPNVSPICLPFPNSELTWQPVVVMGWGLTQFSFASYTLQEATLSVVPNNICQDQYGQSNPITDQMICAWGHGKDACRGDSGGPLIWNTEGRWFVVGIVSFGMPCGPTSTTAGVFTRVDRFLQWIVSETEDDACLAPATTQPTPYYPWQITTRTSTQIPTFSSSSPLSTGRSTSSGRSSGTSPRSGTAAPRAV